MTVAVGIFATRSDAELAQSALDAAGISSVISADDAGGAYPFDLGGGARLLVEDADAEDAKAILADGSHPRGDEQQ
jgi:putative signal transducing protein